ncbi:ras small monomeric GTPase [Seiridium cupressi]
MTSIGSPQAASPGRTASGCSPRPRARSGKAKKSVRPSIHSTSETARRRDGGATTLAASTSTTHTSTARLEALPLQGPRLNLVCASAFGGALHSQAHSYPRSSPHSKQAASQPAPGPGPGPGARPKTKTSTSSPHTRCRPPSPKLPPPLTSQKVLRRFLVFFFERPRQSSNPRSAPHRQPLPRPNQRHGGPLPRIAALHHATNRRAQAQQLEVIDPLQSACLLAHLVSHRLQPPARRHLLKYTDGHLYPSVNSTQVERNATQRHEASVACQLKPLPGANPSAFSSRSIKAHLQLALSTMAGKMVLYKLVVLGDGGVGKTALTIQLCLQHFVETYDPTIEDSYRKQVVIDGQACMLEVLDTAGQEEYTALRDQWIRDGEGFVLVYSISSRSSFSRIKRFHHQIQRVKESVNSSPSYPGSPISAASPSPNVPVMLVGNKSDRVTEREVSTQEGHALARELGCEFVEASAKNCINVEKAFYDVVRILRRQRQAAARPMAPSRMNKENGNPGSGKKAGRKHENRGGRCVIL